MIILYYGQFGHVSYCENWIAEALDRGGHLTVRMERSEWFDEHRVLAAARLHRAELLLLSKTPEITPDQLSFIKSQSNMKVAFWTFDWMRHPDSWEWYRPLAQLADVCFQTDGYGEEDIYKEHGINRVELHQGCVPGLHDLPDPRLLKAPANFVGAHYGAEILFAGSEYTERRIELIRELSAYPGFVKRGHPQAQLWGVHFARSVYFSKIIIGDNFVNDVPGYWSDRVYLTLACGGFFLTAYVPGLERKFEKHHHLVWWESFDELREQIAYYLPREGSRRSIALAGYQRVHARHTYGDRIREFSRVIHAL